MKNLLNYSKQTKVDSMKQSFNDVLKLNDILSKVTNDGSYNINLHGSNTVHIYGNTSQIEGEIYFNITKIESDGASVGFKQTLNIWGSYWNDIQINPW